MTYNVIEKFTIKDRGIVFVVKADKYLETLCNSNNINGSVLNFNDQGILSVGKVLGVERFGFRKIYEKEDCALLITG